MYKKIISSPRETALIVPGLEPVVIEWPAGPADYTQMKGVVPQNDYGNIFVYEILNTMPIFTSTEFMGEFFSSEALLFDNENQVFCNVKKLFGLQNYAFSSNNLLWYYAQPTAKMFRWIDSYMKVYAEKHEDDAAHTSLLRSMNVFSAFAKMTSPSGESAYFLHHLDVLSSNLVIACSMAYGFGQPLSANETLAQAVLRNKIYLQVLCEHNSLTENLIDLLANAVYSGNSILKTVELTRENAADTLYGLLEKQISLPLAIDDREKFLRQALTAKSLVYVPDDNGESVFDLALLQGLLKDNPDLKIFIVINEKMVSNNLNVETLKAILAEEYFSKLCVQEQTGNLQFLTIDSNMDVPLASDLSPTAQKIITDSDVVMVKGQMFFEYCDMYNLNPNTYHLFVSSSDAGTRLTGVPKGSGIVAHISSEQAKYVIEDKKYIKKTLRDLRAGEN